MNSCFQDAGIMSYPQDNRNKLLVLWSFSQGQYDTLHYFLLSHYIGGESVLWVSDEQFPLRTKPVSQWTSRGTEVIYISDVHIMSARPSCWFYHGHILIGSLPQLSAHKLVPCLLINKNASVEWNIYWCMVLWFSQMTFDHIPTKNGCHIKTSGETTVVIPNVVTIGSNFTALSIAMSSSFTSLHIIGNVQLKMYLSKVDTVVCFGGLY